MVKTQAEASQRQRVKQWAAAYKRNTHRALAELLTFIAEVSVHIPCPSLKPSCPHSLVPTGDAALRTRTLYAAAVGLPCALVMRKSAAAPQNPFFRGLRVSHSVE